MDLYVELTYRHDGLYKEYTDAFGLIWKYHALFYDIGENVHNDCFSCSMLIVVVCLLILFGLRYDV